MIELKFDGSGRLYRPDLRGENEADRNWERAKDKPRGTITMELQKMGFPPDQIQQLGPFIDRYHDCPSGKNSRDDPWFIRIMEVKFFDGNIVAILTAYTCFRTDYELYLIYGDRLAVNGLDLDSFDSFLNKDKKAAPIGINQVTFNSDEHSFTVVVKTADGEVVSCVLIEGKHFLMR